MGSKVQSMFLKVKEASGIGYITSTVDDDGRASILIRASTESSAKVARMLVEINFKEQIKYQLEMQRLHMVNPLLLHHHVYRSHSCCLDVPFYSSDAGESVRGSGRGGLWSAHRVHGAHRSVGPHHRQEGQSHPRGRGGDRGHRCPHRRRDRLGSEVLGATVYN
jgi:hypothetical protein